MAKKKESHNKKSTKGKSTREKLITSQLHRLGKVGGLKDLRLGQRGRHGAPEQSALQRHIVEKLRQLDKVTFEQDEDDPMHRAAFGDGNKMSSLHFRLDDQADGGIQADAAEEFFGRARDSGSFRDALSEKIAASKLEKLKRVEENEEQRGRLKTVDTEWSQKIRFMLSQIPSLKSKVVPSARSRGNQTSVSALLEELSTDRKITPADVKTSEGSEEKHLKKLQMVIESRLAAPVDHSSISAEPVSPGNTKLTENALLRVLLRMPEHERKTVDFLADRLGQAQFRNLKDIIRHLYLAQLLVQHFHTKSARDVRTTPIETHKSKGSAVLSPELVNVLARMWNQAGSSSSSGKQEPFKECSGDEDRKLLVLRRSMVDTELESYDKLDINWVESPTKLPREQLPLIRLACLNRLAHLSLEIHQLYAKLLPACVCAQLFASMRTSLTALDMSRLPEKLRLHITELQQLIDLTVTAPTPNPLSFNARLTILSSEQSSNARTLKKLGLVPQLEPRFEERLDARRPKAGDLKRSLKRKVAREKRGAMREIRRDGEFLAAHQLKMTKTSDETRNKKTQAILNSLRAIED
ncbi:hypothetical protein T265_11580 [Opisthorchis viverrini]|uniref:Nucleolar protein 14 n=1 Tax=Opisthorchis viverrini TaxID=6198 RepID=A0A074Z2J4_OPIVI|nr:hypothetical protein T265_11580 [Opisthorchis viverrini]KER19722.1 hypothetical protein T265_11580 [Opisthorchis viverrini]